MKRSLLLTIAFAFVSMYAIAQCTAPAATGSPGITPVTDSLPCIERGNAYSTTINIENFNTFSVNVPIVGQVTAQVNFLRIDSITNLPCGMTWDADQANNTYIGGQTGCLALTGTTSDQVGQYRLGIYISVEATVPGLGTLPFDGEASDVLDQVEQVAGPLGVDFRYFLRVIDAGSACPAVDRNLTPGATSSGASCPAFAVSITGGTSVCAGNTTTLTASVVGGTSPYSYEWSGSSIVLNNITVGAGTQSVTVTDNGGQTATSSVTVTADPVPAADATVTSTDDYDVTFNSSGSTDATSYTWDFGDGTGTSSDANPTYTYASADTFTVSLIASNGCGADTAYVDAYPTAPDSINIGITPTALTIGMELYPNPTQGIVTVALSDVKGLSGTLEIVNLAGQRVFVKDLRSAGVEMKERIDLSKVGAGIYFVKVTTINGQRTQKLLVQ